MTPLLAWRRAIVDRSAAYAGHRKVSPSACGRYRVVWRDEAYGVALTREYHAMIRGDEPRGRPRDCLTLAARSLQLRHSPP